MREIRFQSKWFERCLKDFLGIKDRAITDKDVQEIKYLFVTTTHDYGLGFAKTLPSELFQTCAFDNAGDEWAFECIEDTGKYQTVEEFLEYDSSNMDDGRKVHTIRLKRDVKRFKYEGVYEVYYGQAAMDKVASMTEYGLTMEELERVLAANMNGYIPGGSKPSDYLYATGELEDDRERYQVCLDTFYAVILHNQRLVSSPEDVQEGGNSTLYIGFYLPELEMSDLTNCNAASYTQWAFQEKTA